MIERIWTQLKQILYVRESTHRTALAFSIGIMIAFSPTYGLHTLTVLFCAWAFRLNFIAVMSGSLINNPWTLVPILGLTFWTGFKITHTAPATFNWDDLGLASLYEQVTPYFFSFLVGGVALSLAGAVVSYPVAYFLLARYRSRRWRKSADEESLPPGTHLG